MRLKTSFFTKAFQFDINTQKYCLKNGWMERKKMEERKERREKFSLNIFSGDIHILFSLTGILKGPNSLGIFHVNKFHHDVG